MEPSFMLGGGGLRRREVVGVEDEGKHWRSRIWYTVIILQTLCAKSVIYCISKPHNNPMRLNIIFLSMRKIRLSRIKWLAQKHRTNNCWGQDSNQISLLQITYSWPYHPHCSIWNRNFTTLLCFLHPHPLNPCCLNTKPGWATQKVQMKWGANMFTSFIWINRLEICFSSLPTNAT